MLASDFLSQSATIVGLMAGCVAVGGFIGHAGPSLSGAPAAELRRLTTVGGIGGLCASLVIIVLSVCVNFLSQPQESLSMSETRALILVFAGVCVIAGIAGAVLALTDANGAVFGFVAFVLSGLAGFASSRVAMRYGKLEKRRKREEIILSR